MPLPLVTVIVPCFNHESYVLECIESIIQQDYENIELIIIDDGSTDSSVIKIRQISERCKGRFTRFHFVTQTNQGISRTLNRGLDWSKGVFVAPLASDDVLYPERVSKQVHKFLSLKSENDQIVAIYSGVDYVNEKGEHLYRRNGSDKFYGFNDIFFRTAFLPTPTFMCLKKALTESGGFDPSKAIEDFYIRLKITKDNHLVYCMSEALVKYRRHNDNLSKKSDKIWIGVQDILNDYKQHARYDKALSMSMLVQSHDYQIISKTKGLKFYLKSIKNYPLNFFTSSSVRFILKAILPRRLIKLKQSGIKR